MKRFHVHVAVPNLAESVRFYSTLFGAPPTVTKDDYAKWMLEDPRVNFAISQRGAKVGINHLGFQVDSDDELEALHTQLESADQAVVAETGANCCYAKSDKYWITDPQGIAWETYHSLGSIPIFGSDAREEAPTTSACCAPAATTCGATVANDARSGCCA
jgi:catechol 2,3-dioxygenase-like lactoylglutathione lyase family enzyme